MQDRRYRDAHPTRSASVPSSNAACVGCSYYCMHIGLTCSDISISRLTGNRRLPRRTRLEKSPPSQIFTEPPRRELGTVIGMQDRCLPTGPFLCGHVHRVVDQCRISSRGRRNDPRSFCRNSPKSHSSKPFRHERDALGESQFVRPARRKSAIEPVGEGFDAQ